MADIATLKSNLEKLKSISDKSGVSKTAIYYLEQEISREEAKLSLANSIVPKVSVPQVNSVLKYQNSSNAYLKDLSAQSNDVSTKDKQDVGNTVLSDILAKIISNPATETSLAALLAANHTDLVALLTKLNSSIAVSGTFWQAIQPISGTVTSKGDLAVSDILTNNTLSQSVRPTKYEYEVALGGRQNSVTWNKWGYNPDIDSAATETIWSVGGTFSRITTASTLDIVSTSTDDINTSGAGAWSIIIYGVDALFASQIEIINLNGTTLVTTSNEWLGVNRVALYLSGANGVNSGDINITATTGGSSQAQIPIGHGATQQAIFFTQAGHTALVDWLLINVTRLSGGGSQPTVTLKGWVLSQVSGSKYEVFRYVMDTAVENHIELNPSQPFVVGEKSILYFECTTDTNNTICSIRFSLIESKNI